MPALLATRVRVAQEGMCWRWLLCSHRQHIPSLQQGAALRVEREQRVLQNALAKLCSPQQE